MRGGEERRKGRGEAEGAGRGRRGGERQKSPVASVTGVTKLRCSHQAGLTAAVLLFLAQ